MEDDDEFGDLYTDVLRPFTSPSQSLQPQNDANTAATTKTASFQSSRRPIDLNNMDSDDEEIFHGALNSNSKPKININNSNNNVNDNDANQFMQPKTLADSQQEFKNRADPKGSISDREVEKIEGSAEGGERGGKLDLGARVLDKSEDRKSQEVAFRQSNLLDEGDIDIVVEEREDKDDFLVEKDKNLAVGNEKIGVEEGEPVIPGFSSSIPGISGGIEDRGDENFDEEYDSDSEDDLQIVLNNDDELGPMGMGRMGGEDDDEDDEDGEPLVIVADNGNLGHQPMMEDQEWGEEAGADGERKELGDSTKVNGGVALQPKVGFNSQPYHHPFHSQFKYVRPGVAPIPGAAPAGTGGIPGQVRPPVNIGPVAGRGRGDWRPAGRGGLPMQKGFGYGMPAWGNNISGRGLDFTLPSHKTIFEVDIDSFEEKPWKLPSIDISDFFNFGLNEDSWKEYCKQLEQHRLETTMQSRIRVYESGRTEQEYDPDLPPELAAASGIQHISSENPNSNVVKTDAGQIDLSRGLARARPPIPTGRPIQVETNYTDRLPSSDTRQSRVRDSDAIIEIICQDSADDENEVVKPQDNEMSREDPRGSEESEDLSEGHVERLNDFSHAYDSRKREFVRTEVINPNHDTKAEADKTFPSDASVQCPSGSRERTPNSIEVHEERTLKGKLRVGSPKVATSGSTRDKQLVHNQKEEESSESIDGKPLSPSCGAVGAAVEEDVEGKVTLSDEFVEADRSFKVEREDMAVDTTTTQEEMLEDENSMPSSKKQKLNLRAEQPSPEIDGGEESKAARSSENSKARSGSSKDYRKPHDGVEEEVVQGGRPMHMASIKRSSGRDEDVIRKKGRDERQETDRYRSSAKGREDSYSRKGWDPNSANYSRVKPDIPDRRREKDNAERAWQRVDEDLHGRRARPEDTRKRDHTDEAGFRHQSNIRESERSKRDEHHQLKEHLDNGSWRGNYDKDIGSKHRDREDNLKSREVSMDNLHSKRRKEEALLRKEHAEREVILHGNRENSSRRKRERDDIPDQRKRDGQGRLRDNDQYDVRHKEEGLFHRERGERQRDRDEWHRPKHPHDDILSKRERDEGRGGIKSVRAVEEKTWTSHSRGKEEYRGSDREYHSKDIARNNEPPKRRDRVENESLTQHKAHMDVHLWANHGNDDRRARNERTSTRDERAASETDIYMVHEKTHKELIRKGKEPKGGDQNPMAPSRRNQVEHSGQISEMGILKGKFEQRTNENEGRVKHQPSSAKHSEEVSSDEEEQANSRRGRTKLERWASHKEERDFATSTKSSSSLKIKESIGPPPSLDKPSKPLDDKQRPSAKDKDVPEMVENRHLDTVEKLKKRSERFKQPLPSEKEATTTKKIEKEPLPSAAQNEIRPETVVIKSERPARKRRWTNN